MAPTPLRAIAIWCAMTGYCPTWCVRTRNARRSKAALTMVIVSHEMGFARDAATRMVFIDRGQVVETGTPAQFFSAPSTDRARQFLQRYTAAGAAAIAAS